MPVKKGMTESGDYADIIRKITGRCPLDYEQNPGFISFRQLSIAAANSTVNKLINNGFKAKRISNYVKIDIN
jgi:hypothetical protein